MKEKFRKRKNRKRNQKTGNFFGNKAQGVCNRNLGKTPFQKSIEAIIKKPQGVINV